MDKKSNKKVYLIAFAAVIGTIILCIFLNKTPLSPGLFFKKTSDNVQMYLIRKKYEKSPVKYDYTKMFDSEPSREQLPPAEDAPVKVPHIFYPTYPEEYK